MYVLLYEWTFITVRYNIRKEATKITTFEDNNNLKQAK